MVAEKNRELYAVHNDLSFTSSIKIQRLKFLGRVLRMEGSSTVKKLYNDSPSGVLSRGRPRSQWGDSSLSDLKQLRINVSYALGQYEWTTVVEQAKGSYVRLLRQLRRTYF